MQLTPASVSECYCRHSQLIYVYWARLSSFISLWNPSVLFITSIIHVYSVIWDIIGVLGYYCIVLSPDNLPKLISPKYFSYMCPNAQPSNQQNKQTKTIKRAWNWFLICSLTVQITIQGTSVSWEKISSVIKRVAPGMGWLNLWFYPVQYWCSYAECLHLEAYSFCEINIYFVISLVCV